jgi:hypothetical protein
MRAAIYELLTSDAAFTALVPQERIIQVNNQGIDDDQVLDAGEGMYATIGIDSRDPALMPRTGVIVARVELTVFDTPGDYSRIDNALLRAKAAAELALPAFFGGQWVQAADWEGESEDAYDDILRAIYRSMTWRVVGPHQLTA